MIPGGSPAPAAADDGDQVLHELMTDLLIKGAIVVVALIVLVVALTIIYRKVGRR